MQNPNRSGAWWLNEPEAWQAREAAQWRQQEQEMNEDRMREEPVANVRAVAVMSPEHHPSPTAQWHRCPLCFWFTLHPATVLVDGNNGIAVCGNKRCGCSYEILVNLHKVES